MTNGVQNKTHPKYNYAPPHLLITKTVSIISKFYRTAELMATNTNREYSSQTS